MVGWERNLTVTAGLAFTQEMFIVKAEQKAAVRRVERILQGRGQRNLLLPADSADLKEQKRGSLSSQLVEEDDTTEV